MKLQQNLRRPCGLLEPDAWKAGTSGSEGAPAQQCAGATRRFRIQRQTKRGTQKRYVYTYPSKKSLASVKAKVRSATRGSTDQSLAIVLHRLNPVLRGWTNYFRYGVSKATFSYLRAFTWRRVICWIRHKHGRIAWKELRRRYLSGWWPTEGEAMLFNPGAVVVSRYRYRADRIPTPWATTEGTAA